MFCRFFSILCRNTLVFVKKSDFELAGNATFPRRIKHGIGDTAFLFACFSNPSQTVLRGLPETEQPSTRAAEWLFFCQKKRVVKEVYGRTLKKRRGEGRKKYFWKKWGEKTEISFFFRTFVRVICMFNINVAGKILRDSCINR